jgi:hypothetical protein
MTTKPQWIARACKAWLLLLFSAAVAVSQGGNKVIQWEEHPHGAKGAIAQPPLQLFDQIDGVEIVEVPVEGVPVTIGQPFNASAEWLGKMSFRVKNVSSEAVAVIQITLRLPEMKKSPWVPYAAGCRRDQPCIKPGEEVELKIPSGRLYDWVKSGVAKETDMSKISRATIHTVLVSLPNGTVWSSGCVKTVGQKDACPHP